MELDELLSGVPPLFTQMLSSTVQKNLPSPVAVLSIEVREDGSSLLVKVVKALSWPIVPLSLLVSSFAHAASISSMAVADMSFIVFMFLFVYLLVP